MIVVAARTLLFLLDRTVRLLISIIAALQNFLIQTLEEPPEPGEEGNLPALNPLLQGLPLPLQEELSRCRISLLGSTCLVVSPVETGYADVDLSEDESDAIWVGVLLHHLRCQHRMQAVVVQEPGQTIRFMFEGDRWHMLRVAA